jgi:ketopantoate reductase
MLKDVLRGSPTEIDAINGAIVTIGDRVNMPVQLNRALWLLIKAILNAPNPQGKGSKGEEADLPAEIALTR